jgi:hypothetical protein
MCDAPLHQMAVASASDLTGQIVPQRPGQPVLMVSSTGIFTTQILKIFSPSRHAALRTQNLEHPRLFQHTSELVGERKNHPGACVPRCTTVQGTIKYSTVQYRAYTVQYGIPSDQSVGRIP